MQNSFPLCGPLVIAKDHRGKNHLFGATPTVISDIWD